MATHTELPVANDSGPMPTDIRDLLRRDHETTLADIESLCDATDHRRALAQLALVRRAWIIHALAEETVVYRALEAAEAARRTRSEADERFIEHELVEGLFEKLSRSRAGTLEWVARLKVAHDLVLRHVETEHEELFARLERAFEPQALLDMGSRFVLARNKLTMLEEAKAA